MSNSYPHRRRLASGVLLAAALGVGLSHWVVVRVRAADTRSRAERAAVVALGALVEIAEKAGGGGEAVRHAVARVGQENRSLKTIRVVAFQGVSLEASTAPEDIGEKAVPRRLSRDEKELYDLGQRLRAAVETNRQEGGARKTEIELGAAPSGGLTLAAPVERDGAMVGFVALETTPISPAPRTSWIPPALALFASLLIFLLAASVAGEHRWALVVIAAAILVASMVGYGRWAFATIAGDRRATEAFLGDEVKAESARAAAVLQEFSLGDAASLHPGAWDADAFRRPLGIISGAGTVDEAALAKNLEGIAGGVRSVVSAFTVLALLLLGFVGLGHAARLGATLRKHRQAYSYAFPALFGMVLLVFLPFLYGVALSFTDQTIYTVGKPIAEIWSGVKNFVDILGDFRIAKQTAEGLAWNYQNIYWTLGITIIWTVTNVAYGVGMGLFLALILNTKGLFARPIYRVIFILPWAMPNYITALIWKGMFHKQFGAINAFIKLLGFEPISFFNNFWTAFFANVATNTWLGFPFMMVICLGALQSIPADL
ncbi:MAG: sugar ABC transporter permease, partial [Acidobacteriota bacterium]